jgi:non-ribosomal peptide synthase protein (TIGR01720 family)
VLLELQLGDDPGQALAAVKEQLRRIPNKGIGYGLLRYGAGAEVSRRLASLPQAEVSFNYLGQFLDGASTPNAIAIAERRIGPTRDGSGLRRYKLDVEGSVRARRMRFDWTYSLDLHTPATIEALARGFVAALRRLIEHCCASENRRYTASDFSLAGLDDGQLEHILRQIRADE